MDGVGRGGERARMSSLEIWGKLSVWYTGEMDVTYIIEFVAIFGALSVDDTFSVPFIAKVAPLVLEVVLDFVFDVKIEEALHYFEQAVCIL